MKKDSESECCPKFDPKPWQEKTLDWYDKPFIKDSIGQIFHMPLPGSINKLMSRMCKSAESAGAAMDDKDFLMLTYDVSPWKSEWYLQVKKEVPGAVNVKITGNFLTKVFDGEYREIPKFIKEMHAWVQSKGKKAGKIYIYYTTCPKCAKKHGHNYMVFFAQI